MEADLTITTSKENYELLEGMDLAEYFITSKANKKLSQTNGVFKIDVKKANGNKCPRCWKILEDKCLRCTQAVT